MKSKLRRCISIFVSCCLVFSAVAFTGGDTRMDSVARAAQTGEGDAGVDVETEFTDEATGFKYKLYLDKDDYGKPILDENGNQAVKAEITGYTGESKSLVIPAKVGGETEYKVGRIGQEAFKGSDITGVVISEGVEQIGVRSFSECLSLQSVRIPSTIVKWKEKVESPNYVNDAFKGCTALTELELAEGMTALGQSAFSGCTALTSVTVPSTITHFPSYVFQGCSQLVNLELKEGITEIGYKAFEGCTSLEEVRIPSTIQTWCTVHQYGGIMAQVRDCAPFYGCTSLKKVTFAEGLTTLEGFQGVRECPLVEALDIPSSVTNVKYAFTNCANLKKVTLHDGLESIGDSAFDGCSALQEVVLPNTVTSLSFRAFYQCTSLEKLVVPPNVTSFSGSFNYGCQLKDVYLLAPSMAYREFSLAADGKYHCAEGSDTYKTYQANVPDKVEAITALSGIEAEGYSGVYDGEPHAALTNTAGILDGDTVLYCIDGKGFQTGVPEITKPGTYTVDVMVTRLAEDGSMQVGMVSTQAEIQKKESSIHLKDMEVTGSEFTIEPESSELAEDAEIIWHYYKDEALQSPCEAKPAEPGVYYVVASVAETETYTACESNAAKLTIVKKVEPTPEVTPTPTPVVTPTPTPVPQNSPSPTPDVTKASPSPAPTEKVTPTAKPTAKPTDKPVAAATLKVAGKLTMGAKEKVTVKAATNQASVKATSSKTQVVKVSAKGKSIKLSAAKKAGKADVTVTAGSKKATIKVTVKAAPKKLKAAKKTVAVKRGKKASTKVKFTPKAAAAYTIKVTNAKQLKKKKVTVIVVNGKITVKADKKAKKGTFTVKLQSYNKKKTTFKVKVK